MNNILCLDIGQKRIGCACKKDNVIIGLPVIYNFDNIKTITQIGQVCREHAIEKIIIGLPKNKNTLQTDKIHTFAMEIAKKLNLPIDYVDESFTSKEAERILQNSNLDEKSEKYKEEVDTISAKLILEQYLSK